MLDTQRFDHTKPILDSFHNKKGDSKKIDYQSGDPADDLNTSFDYLNNTMNLGDPRPDATAAIPDRPRRFREAAASIPDAENSLKKLLQDRFNKVEAWQKDVVTEAVDFLDAKTPDWLATQPAAAEANQTTSEKITPIEPANTELNASRIMLHTVAEGLFARSQDKRRAAQQELIGKTIELTPEKTFVVLAHIGDGGFGSVFKVKNVHTGQEGAMKILQPCNMKKLDYDPAINRNPTDQELNALSPQERNQYEQLLNREMHDVSHTRMSIMEMATLRRLQYQADHPTDPSVDVSDITPKLLAAQFVPDPRTLHHDANGHPIAANNIDQRLPVIVTEFNPGKNLKAFFTEHQDQPLLLVEVMKQIVSHLEKAHHLGIVHSDIKPENVLIEKEGDVVKVQLLDFGIAMVVDPRQYWKDRLGRASEPSQTAIRTERPEKLTTVPVYSQQDMLTGTLDYLPSSNSGRQRNFELPSKARDRGALGLVLRHLIFGQDAKDPAAMKARVWTLPFPLRQFAEIADTLVRPTPNDRASWQEVLAALDRLNHDEAAIEHIEAAIQGNDASSVLASQNNDQKTAPMPKKLNS